MKLLDKYLFKQILFSFLFGLLLVIIVWITPELLPKIVKKVVSCDLTLIDGILVLIYEIPEVIVKSLPMGMLIGSLLVFDRLSKDFEITAMRSSGISIYRMLLSVMILGVFATLSGFFINEVLVPNASYAQEKILKNGQIASTNFSYVDKDNDSIKQVILIEQYDGEKIENIRILNFKPHKKSKAVLSEIITASQSSWDDGSWTLTDGIYYRLNPEGIYEESKPFANKKVLSNKNSYELMKMSLKKPKHMNMIEIIDYISLLVQSNHHDEMRYFAVTFQQKFSQPFAAIILGIVGLILGLHPPRTSRFLGYTVGIIVILLYYFIWPISMTLGNIGAIPAFWAAWIPNFLAMAIGLIILKYKDF